MATVFKIANSHHKVDLSYCNLNSHLHFKLLEVSAFKIPEVKFSFNLYSTDGWDRQRLEGYGCASLHITRGYHEVKIPLWRPSGSPNECLKSFFLGGSFHSQDSEEHAKPKVQYSTVCNCA